MKHLLTKSILAGVAIAALAISAARGETPATVSRVCHFIGGFSRSVR